MIYLFLPTMFPWQPRIGHLSLQLRELVVGELSILYNKTLNLSSSITIVVKVLSLTKPWLSFLCLQPRSAPRLLLPANGNNFYIPEMGNNTRPVSSGDFGEKCSCMDRTEPPRGDAIHVCDMNGVPFAPTQMLFLWVICHAKWAVWQKTSASFYKKQLAFVYLWHIFTFSPP